VGGRRRCRRCEPRRRRGLGIARRAGWLRRRRRRRHRHGHRRQRVGSRRRSRRARDGDGRRGASGGGRPRLRHRRRWCPRPPRRHRVDRTRGRAPLAAGTGVLGDLSSRRRQLASGADVAGHAGAPRAPARQHGADRRHRHVGLRARRRLGLDLAGPRSHRRRRVQRQRDRQLHGRPGGVVVVCRRAGADEPLDTPAHGRRLSPGRCVLERGLGLWTLRRDGDVGRHARRVGRAGARQGPQDRGRGQLHRRALVRRGGRERAHDRALRSGVRDERVAQRSEPGPRRRGRRGDPGTCDDGEHDRRPRLDVGERRPRHRCR